MALPSALPLRKRSMLTAALRWAAVLVAGLLAVPAIVLWAVLDASPVFTDHQGASPASVHAAAQWLKRLDPRATPFQVLPGNTPSVLPAAALQALAQDAAQRLLGAGADVRLMAGQARVGLSLPLTATPAARWLPRRWCESLWLNVRTHWVESPQRGLPELQQLRVGALPLPVGPQAWNVALRLGGMPTAWQRLRTAAQTVEHVSFTPQGLGVQLLPALTLAERLREQWLPGVDIQQLHRHHEALARELARQAAEPGPSPQAPVPLNAVLGPALANANRLSPAAWGDAARAQAYRLAVLTVTLYAFQVQPGWFAPDQAWSNLPKRQVVLRGRHDHALHYLLSATLVMGADRSLADALGTYKELADAGDPRGSGFSFDDIAADKAGAALGFRALHQPQRLAQLLPLMVDDVFLMPAVDGLPTGLTAAQFEERFGSTDSPRFQAQMAEVERRIQALQLLGR